MCRIKKIFHGKQILVVGSLWANPLANLKQLVNSFISLLARILAKETGRFETGRFDTNSSSEIAQKFWSLQVKFVIEQEKYFGWIFFVL